MKKKIFYPCLDDARNAVNSLNITSCTEYQRRYKEDSMLPSAIHLVYKDEWLGWRHFFGHKDYKYHTLRLASKAVQSLGIVSGKEYRKRYVEDPYLPSNPSRTYKKEWVSWYHFFGKQKIPFYDSIEDASSAAKKLMISSCEDYKNKYRKDSRLPPFPQNFYIEEWNGWHDFLGASVRPFYESLIEASLAAKALGINSESEYRKRYKEDPSLPSVPSEKYADEWVDWYHFFGKRKSEFYDKLSDASSAAINLGIKSSTEYFQRYREDKLLPHSPFVFYIDEWSDWNKFLGFEKKNYYETLSQAIEAVNLLNIRTEKEYRKRYKEDSRLPADPKRHYSKEWKNWPEFFNRKKKSIYKKIEEAKIAANKLLITSRSEYLSRYHEDPKLPSTPDKFYKKDWSGWLSFLLLDKVSNLKEFRVCCKVLGITNSSEYKKVRKLYPHLPSKPERKVEGWIDWYDSLALPRPYSYADLVAIVRSNGCKTMADYQKMRIKLSDPQIPSSPEEVYKPNGWINTYDFFGKPRPYQVKYFTDEWKQWAVKIEEFLKSARGGDTKAKDLCEFVREYIEPNGFEKCPLGFLTRGSTNIQPMLELFNKELVTRKKKWLYSINEFLDWLIYRYLLLEDVDTGEITPIKGANNPFLHINFNSESPTQVISETNKLALPYQFVKSGREWIFPSDMINNEPSYSDLPHLHRFSADWVAIEDISLIDDNDPDCIIKVENGKTYLWLPIYWTYTYALMQLPARGMQIVYCDSGEADLELADFRKQKVIWKKNKSHFAGLTNHQGMVSKAGKDDFGVHYTSNKTHFDGKGYSIPFMPIDLAYWLIKLRKWQQKYNPILEPTKWLKCKRTNLNETQRKQKGINCFLFRDYQDVEPGSFSGRLTLRLAAALFFSAKEETTLATFKGMKYVDAISSIKSEKLIPLYLFKSQYTPHSMRVSLINAYAYEFGIPLEVIMKLVGHSSIIMSIYYVKSDKTGANIRERIEKGEKEALSNAAKTFKSYIEQQRIEECKSHLVASSSEFLNSLDNTRPASNYLFKDFGICPVGGALCSEGGQPVATKANIYHPVTAGYLGEQNCVQCRFFVTGPAFMVGLAALFNEVSLAVNTQSFRYSKLEAVLNQTAQEIEVISHKLYERKKADDRLERERKDLIFQRQKLNSEIETRAKKLDLYMSDMNALHRHIHNCQQVLDQQIHSNEVSKLQLIVPRQFEIDVELDEVSSFHQLSEVCENAELYHSCSDELAVTRRSQALDQMMVRNNMPPRMFLLSEEEQLAVGNQLTQLMLSRLESWESVDRLMDGRLSMMDLSEDTKFTANTIQELFERSQPLKRIK